MERSSYLHTVLDETVTVSTTTDAQIIENYGTVVNHVVYDVQAPAAFDFVAADVDIDENTVTEADHGFALGTKVRLTTDGTLPAGLSTGTDYFIIPVDSATIKFATSHANAVAGTAVNITDTGSVGGTHTVTMVTLSCSAQVQVSINGTDWASLGSAITVTADGSTMAAVTDNGYQYIRLAITQTAGQVAFKFLVRGQR